MKTATGLTLVAIGAILAFAVKAHPHFLNLHVAGWVIMLTGLVGIFVPRRGYGWLRGHVVVKRGARVPVASGETSAPPYVVLDTTPLPERDASASGAAAPDGLPPLESETVEEYFEE
jgi:hypothetical protein